MDVVNDSISDDQGESDSGKLDKESSIRDALKWKDLDTLRALATTEGGFLKDELRRQAC
jgi:hypothetical protein